MATTHAALNGWKANCERSEDLPSSPSTLSTTLSSKEGFAMDLLLDDFYLPSAPPTPHNSPVSSPSTDDALDLLCCSDPPVPLAPLVPQVSEHRPIVTDSCFVMTPADVSMALAPCPIPYRRGAAEGAEAKVTGGVAKRQGASESTTGTSTTDTSRGPLPVPTIDSAKAKTSPSIKCSSSTTTTITSSSSSSSSSSSPSPSSSSSPNRPTTTLKLEMRDGARPLPPEDRPSPCSSACARNFERLSRELAETRDQLFALSVQMAEQASHITKLMEENRRYIRENGKLKSRTRGGVVNGANYIDGFGHQSSDYPQQNGDTDLEDKILALQLQNSELALRLERERRKRKEAETKLERDEGYIKRLEDSVQTLRGSRVVMDPATYRQVAEAYIAARRTPARRPHTHHEATGSNLVCDGSSTNNQRLSYPATLETDTTCSSSLQDSSMSSYSSYPDTASSALYPSSTTTEDQRRRHSKKVRGYSSQELPLGESTNLGASMNPWDYQQLLESLEDLDGGSRGALS